MHQLRLNLTKTEKVFVTRHAKQRLYQRCKLIFNKSELNDIDFTIRREFKKSAIDMSFEVSSFERNKSDLIYGVGSFRTTTKRLKIFGNYNSNTNSLVITTVILNKNYYFLTIL